VRELIEANFRLASYLIKTFDRRPGYRLVTVRLSRRQGLPPDPGVAQVEYFRYLSLNADNRPLLVVAPSSEIPAVTWAAYRLRLGAPLAYAIYEAKSIGLRCEQESALPGWQQK
jgi:hypothetical protein